MSKDSDNNGILNRISVFQQDDSGIVWGIIVATMTIVGAMLVFASMGIVFDEVYTMAHADNSTFGASTQGLQTFDTMYDMVGYTPIIVLFSIFLYVLVRAILNG